MKDLSLSTRLYIIGTLIAGSICLVFYLPRLSWQSEWLPVVILALLASLSLLFKVEGSTNRTHYNLTFLLYGYCLILYGAPVTILVMTVSHIVEWIWHKYHWYIQLFNLGSYIIVATGSTLVYELANPARLTTTWQGVLSMLAALTFFALFNHLMVGIIVWLARGENFEQSGIFQFFSLMLDYVLLCLGAGLAVMWVANPLAIILVLLSLYLIYTTLRVPALERQAESDSKTGLYNHKYFMTELENELRRANRFSRPLTIVMADLDLLRNINNTYGHLAGDEVLVGVAMILKDNAREYDVVSRFGGEEFAILMTETSVDEAYPIIQSIRAAIEKAEFVVPTSVQPIRATMSFGIAGRKEGLDSKDIIHSADIALYHAKLKGRNRVLTYKEEAVEDQPAGGPSIFSGASFPSIENYPSSTAAPLPEMQASAPASVAGTPERAEPVRVVGHPRLVNLFIGLVFVTAFGLFALTVQDLRQVDWQGVLTFAILVAAAEWASVEIYVRDTAVSTSALPLIAGLLLFGPISVLIMGLAIAVVAWIKHGSPFSRFIFNWGNQLFAGITCILLIRLTGLPFATWSIPIQVVASALAGLLVFLITSCFVSAGIYLNFRAPFRQLWRDQFGWLAPYYLGMGLIAYSLVFSYRESGILGTIVILVPMILLRTSQKQFIDRTKSAVNELKDKNETLEQHFGEIDRLNDGLLDTLAEVIDLRDPYVLGHSRQVTRYAVAIARELRLDADQVEIIHKASLMHDLGKLGIQADLLAKPSSLTREEFEQIKLHVTVGANLLQKSKALESLISIVLHHHEHYDGMGYPDGLKAADIPLEARIVCLADSVDAMATSRPYRKAMSFEEIMAEVTRCSGSHFDPEVIKAFERVVEKKGRAWIEITEYPLPEVN
jgi:diguanylate cyclase (GGDEF)-like protein/putative nucleotidyltransferase with HDIG domain